MLGGEALLAAIGGGEARRIGAGHRTATDRLAEGRPARAVGIDEVVFDIHQRVAAALELGVDAACQLLHEGAGAARHRRFGTAEEGAERVAGGTDARGGLLCAAVAFPGIRLVRQVARIGLKAAKDEALLLE